VTKELKFSTPKRPSAPPSPSYYGSQTQQYVPVQFEKLSDEEATKHLLTDLSKTEILLILDRLLIQNPNYKELFGFQCKTIIGERIN